MNQASFAHSSRDLLELTRLTREVTRIFRYEVELCAAIFWVADVLITQRDEETARARRKLRKIAKPYLKLPTRRFLLQSSATCCKRSFRRLPNAIPTRRSRPEMCRKRRKKHLVIKLKVKMSRALAGMASASGITSIMLPSPLVTLEANYPVGARSTGVLISGLRIIMIVIIIRTRYRQNRRNTHFCNQRSKNFLVLNPPPPKKNPNTRGYHWALNICLPVN